MNSFPCGEIFFGTRWLAAVGNPTKKKGRKRASSYTQRMRRFRRCSERRVRKPTKKKAETSSPKHHKGFFAIYAVSPTCWRSHMKSALTSRCHMNDGAQTAVQQKRLSDLPAASRLWTNGTPRQSTEWRPRDRKWFNHSSSALEKSGKQWRQEELSFFLRGERWATARCRFRRTRKSRNTQVQDSGHSGDLPLDRAAAISLPGFFRCSSASVHVSLSSHRPGNGCQPRLDSLHARLPSISECSAANTADKVRTNDTHYVLVRSQGRGLYRALETRA